MSQRFYGLKVWVVFAESENQTNGYESSFELLKSAEVVSRKGPADSITIAHPFYGFGELLKQLLSQSGVKT